MPKGKILITMSECARKLGVSPTTIHKGCKNGRFKTYKKNGKNLVNFVECRSVYINTATRGGSKPTGAKNKNTIADKINGSASTPESGGTLNGDSDLNNMFDIHSIRLVTERNKALKEKLLLEVAQKKYILFGDVKKEFSDIAETLKKSILSIPDRLAPLIAGESDSHTVRLMLMKELKQSLNGIVKSNIIEKTESEQ